MAATALSTLTTGYTEADIPAIAKATRHDPHLQHAIAHSLGERGESMTGTELRLALELAREAVASDGGLDYHYLDTYSYLVGQAGLRQEAATVSWRVLDLCKSIRAMCLIERRRAYVLIYRARNK
jgi:hypothetical protein